MKAESKIYGIIMAGGGGTRFWPLSRKNFPKQLLNLSGKDAMINEAIARLARITSPENIFIITNEAQASAMRGIVQNRIPGENILLEPAARNTAACIGYAAAKIVAEFGDGVMVITPSDAYIRDEEEFARVLNTAVSAVEKTDKLLTVGITPTFPATGYGYIHYKDGDSPVKEVEEFVEKPDLATAKKYCASGEYVWNSGMFVWRASTILKRFQEFLPDIYELLMEIVQSFGTPEEADTLQRVYPSLRSISVDYGIMEKSKDILVVPGEFGWSDVGSWDMLGALHAKDENGSVAVGDVIALDSKNSIVYSKEKLVALIGVENLIVVETDDALLVCPKERAQEVKNIVDQLKEKGRVDLL